MPAAQATVPLMIDSEDRAAEEAHRRIHEWQPGRALDLAIADLTFIPDAIGELKDLTALYLSVFDDRRPTRCSSVRSLAPLADLPQLQTLGCLGTEVTDLGPLAKLLQLQTLDCSGTAVTDLGPLAELSQLQTLDCSGTSITDLGPLAELSQLQTLHCSRTAVTDLGPLAKLLQLQTLHCSDTSITDLGPLAKLLQLQTLHCSDTSITDLGPLAKLLQLQTLNCSGTEVTDLGPPNTCVALRSLSINDCRVSRISDGFWEKDSLESLYAHDTLLPDVPAEVLSQSIADNCLYRLRAHLHDISAGAVRLHDAKLMVLGNGEVGKTQLCRWLRDEPFDERVPSTHGVTVSSIETPDRQGRLHLWDFGGQDIYHSTHTLFLRSRAIFVIAWTPAKEARDAGSTSEEPSFRDYPLAYWLDYAREFGDAAAAVIVVQTQCDRREDDATPASDAIERLTRFERPVRVIQFSAKTNRYGATLREAIADAYQAIEKPLVGTVRARVKAQLEALRDTDAVRLNPSDRTHRTLSRHEFEDLCEAAGGVTDTDLFLKFLHDCGTVFYQPGQFDDQLILDQSWALEAIYDLFHRDGCWQTLRELNGRFTRRLLGDLLWNERGLGGDEQRLLLSMMESCGICFEHRAADPARNIEAGYIAPDLLLSEQPTDVGAEWDEQTETLRETVIFPFLTPTLMRSVISTVGSEAGLSADYWRSGVYLYDRKRRSRAFVVQRWRGDWSGEIAVACQNGDATALRDALVKLVSREAKRLGLGFDRQESEREPPNREPGVNGAAVEPPAIEYGREPSSTSRWYVSHAWKDAATNDELVRRFCEHARTAGCVILRDDEQLSAGESIEQFMHEMSRGERVYVFLSRAYLESDWCMTELHRLWNRCERNEDAFAHRVRVHLADGIKPRDTRQMHQTLDYWLDRLADFDRRPLSAASARMHADAARIREFANETYDILSGVYDRVQFRDEATLFADI